mmetsp:Transcript_28000/g.81949  ORF Transcript_28000/g.81949 Transcript_28000/m.81949 type:complete len:202 (-) Transcript_28000:275-880(-)|eukprot:CAMPEP_0118973302 /NCGR_PEP_ID=MMETSP1173-20130426/9719_1 /TAXON_ID=1034831 /ORGANISM="Rhizochromulina marina cf, Strain CCMP1243" /LENGTH=201 /DNA_ID=CAMNT_0006922929 /DNA_START=33 /DNA_END=638 /DNA_ORIENTATION=+
MKCVAILLAFAASAAAFAPSPVRPMAVRAAAPRMSVFEDYVGGEGGFGASKPYNFDPLEFSEKNPEMVPWYREAELKHGRMAMLATVGFVAPEFFRVPGDMFQGISTVEAHDALIKTSMLQLLFWIGLAETVIGIPAVVATMKGERAPGDFQFGMNFAPKDEAKFKTKQLAELKNGRLAMLAFSGMVTQAVLTGNGFPFLY